MIVEYTFDHDVETVYATLTNPAFLIDRALSLGNEKADANLQESGSNRIIELERTRQIKVPAILNALLKQTQTATSKELWRKDGEGYVAESTADIDGAPISLNGTIRLSPSGTSCHFKADVTVKARVLIAKRTLKKYASKTVAKELELECEYTAKYLA